MKVCWLGYKGTSIGWKNFALRGEYSQLAAYERARRALRSECELRELKLASFDATTGRENKKKDIIWMSFFLFW